VGDESEVAGLMNDLDFKYMRDGEDFAHSSAIMILTPEGKISQYFTGVLFSPWDVRLTLGEASEGLIGSAIDNLLQYCFRFDPAKGGYSWTAAGLSGVAGFVAVLFFSGLILIRVLAARARKL
jgi:protein SCO1/2